MKTIVAGHEYELDNIRDDGCQKLNFRNINNGADAVGTSNQEVVRALIDRVKFLDNQVHWHGTELILQHLRMVIALHESRHLERMAQKKEYDPEEIEINNRGHFDLKIGDG